MNHTEYPYKAQARRNNYNRILDLGKNCRVKAWIANELRRWVAYTKILRCYQWMRVTGRAVSIFRIAFNSSAHRNTVRKALQYSISDCKKALKMLRVLRKLAWSECYLWGERAEIVSKDYLNFCSEERHVWYDKVFSPVGFIQRLRANKRLGVPKDLALRASGLFRLSKLNTPQVGTFSTSDPIPPYD